MRDTELLEAFLTEAGEHMATVEDDVLAVERGEADTETINHLFRALHTVKGGSSLLDLRTITTLAHDLENVVGKLREGTLQPDEEITDALPRGPALRPGHSHRQGDQPEPAHHHGAAHAAGCARPGQHPRAGGAGHGPGGHLRPPAAASDRGAKMIAALGGIMVGEDAAAVDRALDGLVDPAGTFYRYTLSASLVGSARKETR